MNMVRQTINVCLSTSVFVVSRVEYFVRARLLQGYQICSIVNQKIHPNMLFYSKRSLYRLITKDVCFIGHFRYICRLLTMICNHYNHIFIMKTYLYLYMMKPNQIEIIK